MTGLAVSTLADPEPHLSPTTTATTHQPRVVITSFGYLHAPAPLADTTVDVREHLRDPHLDPRLRELTGNDSDVIERVLHTPGAHGVIEGVVTATLGLIHGARATGRPVVRVAIGCAGGRHRSPALAHAIAERLARRDVVTSTEHLHIDQAVVTRRAALRED
jgi:RNase adaptor protein for sRNA GlmZ degradation